KGKVNLIIQDCNFSNNSAEYGGAVFGENIQIANSTFTNNSVSGSYATGGAVYGHDIQIANSTFSNNSVSGSYAKGGAVFGYNLEIANSTFSNNSANSGGAVSGGNLEIENSIFSNNFANSGGAIYAIDDIMVITNSIFAKNRSFGNGGAVYIGGGKITNSLFIENNSSKSGGAIFSEYGTKITNSIFTQNISENNISIDAPSLSLIYNYLDINRAKNISTNYHNIQPQEGDILFDENFSLPANSVLIDKGVEIDTGTLTYLYAVDNSMPPFDMECNERVVNGKMDIGPIEFGGREGNSCNGNSSNVVKNSDVVIPIHQGWNLVAVDINLSDIPNDIFIIWTYSDGNWSAYSPHEEFTQAISDSGFPIISKPLNSNQGTWFLSNSNFNLIYTKPLQHESNFSTPEIPTISAPNIGWNLLGTATTIPTNIVKCENGEVQIIWRYIDNSWLFYEPDIDPSTLENTFQAIKANDGFWVKCK
ncbi:MAG TPA: hypothetical protein EYG60_02330, partial [Campylobacterales bacterium]|nr:hypothetical protein [Campylobacterales bacterium]